jgi:hypothetical protein
LVPLQWDANTYATTATYANTYTDSHSHDNANADADTVDYSYTYTDAWPDRNDSVGAQGAGQAYGGPLLDRSDLG